MKRIVNQYCEFPAFVRKPMWRVWHELISHFDKNKEVTFMNYGYQSLNGNEQIELLEADEKNRYCIQLYHQVASQVDLTNKDVLEVGSGRGGGGSYITRYLKPKSYIGMDISGSVIKFCRKVHHVPGLSFKKGVAEKIPYPAESFDALVNVESARCYADIKVFFSEVNRVLRPDGHFLFADMVTKGHIDAIRKMLEESRFTILNEQDITPNVVKALGLDHERREALVNTMVPKFLKGGFLQFAGAKGTERYESFATGNIGYWLFLLKKN